jgi:hypothetical protein
MNMQTMQAPDQALELIDIYGLWHVPLWQRPWFIPLVVAVLLLVAAAIGWYMYRRRARTVVVAPWQYTLEQLGRLDRLAQDAHQGEQFYVRITTLLKFYLSDYFGQDLASMTDQQLVDYVAQTDCPEQHKKMIERIFYGGQMVKFAQQATLVQQMQQDLAQAIQLVQELHARAELAKTKTM